MNKKIIAGLCLLVLILAARCSDCARAESKTETPSLDELQLKDYTLQNHDLALTVCLAGNQCKHRAINNRIVGVPYYMEGEDFVLQFEGETINSSEMQVSKVEPGDNDLKFYMSSSTLPVEAVLEFQVPVSGNFAQKTVSLRMRKGKKFLKSIRLIDLREGHENPETFPGPGQPVYKKNRFFAIAYPLSRADISGQEIKIWYEVGKEIGQEWYTSYPGVIGVAEDGKVREYFFNYLDQVRHRAPKPYLLYNTWYDMPGTVNSQGVVNAIEAIKQNLAGPYGIKLDAVVLDDGWDNHSTVWQFDSKKFPQGIAPVKEAASEIGAKPGMWFSPAGGYGEAKTERLLKNLAKGYEKNPSFSNPVASGFCPAGKKYSKEFASRIVRETNNGVAYFKIDNIGDSCETPWHGHPIGDYAKAALTDSIIGIMDQAHQANPGVFFNITVGTWLSPFWLLYADCVWLGGSDYSFSGPGSKREQSITYRDQRIYKQFRENNYQFPLNGVMTHGVIRGKAQFKDPGPIDEFERDTIMYLGRGISMWELYISPDILTKEEWAVLAKWIKWADENWDTLKNSRMALGDPNKLEIYGYLHLKGDAAILVLRNPSDKPQSVSLDPAALGLKSFGSASQEYPSIQHFTIHNSSFEMPMKPFQVSILRLSQIQ